MRFNETRNLNRNRVPIMMGISLLFHGLVVLLFSGFVTFGAPENASTKAQKSRSLRVRVVSELPTKKKKNKKKEPIEKLQIVSAPKPEKELVPEDPKFADRYASRVKKQTVKKGQKGSPVIANKKANDKRTAPPKLSKGKQEKENQVKKTKVCRSF